jgi:acylphosphatase
MEARRLGVRGWVRNLWDGRVEAVFEGAPDQVDEIIAWCKHGPPSARVDEVDLVWEEPTGEVSAFDVRSTGGGAR